MNQVMTDPILYDYGSYRRVGRYLEFICNYITLKLPKGFNYNMEDSDIYIDNKKFKGKVAVIGWESKIIKVESIKQKENAMEKFKVGDRVYCIRNGLLEITEKRQSGFDADLMLLAKSSENKPLRYSYYLDGRMMKSDNNPTLLTLQEARDKGYDVPKQKIVKEETAFMNIYSDGYKYIYPTRELALKHQNGDHSGIAIPVTVKYEVDEE